MSAGVPPAPAGVLSYGCFLICHLINFNNIRLVQYLNTCQCSCAVVGAFSSGGNSPVITQYLKSCMKRTITPFLGRMADFLGSIRPEVKEKVKTEKERKAVYQSLLVQGISEEKLPVREDVQREIQKRGNEYGQNEKTQTE